MQRCKKNYLPWYYNQNQCMLPSTEGQSFLLVNHHCSAYLTAVYVNVTTIRICNVTTSPHFDAILPKFGREIYFETTLAAIRNKSMHACRVLWWLVIWHTSCSSRCVIHHFRQRCQLVTRPLLSSRYTIVETQTPRNISKAIPGRICKYCSFHVLIPKVTCSLL